MNRGKYSRRRFLHQGLVTAGGFLLASRLRLSGEGVRNGDRSTLESDIVDLAVRDGVAFLGAAAMDAIYGMPGVVVDGPHPPRGIAVGFRLDSPVVEASPVNPEAFGRHVYDEVMPKTIAAAKSIGDFLVGRGHGVVPDRTGITALPELVAWRAGLGWIGKCGRLVTPQVGPRVVWACVLTDAPISPTPTPPSARNCVECVNCIAVCPAKALKDVAEDPVNPFATYDRRACLTYRQEQGGIKGKGACGRCLRICPCGQSRNIALALPCASGGPEAERTGAKAGSILCPEQNRPGTAGAVSKTR